MTPTKLAGLALVSLVGLAAASTSALAQPGPEPGAWAWHDGATFEASIGLGLEYLAADSSGDPGETDVVYTSVDLGIGGFVLPRVAISLRLASNTLSTDGLTTTIAIVGPHVQYWLSPQLWLGGGAGLATARFLFGNTAPDGGTAEGANGFGVDLRVGFTFAQRWRHSFNVSVEATPSRINGEWSTGLTGNLGFQFL